MFPVFSLPFVNWRQSSSMSWEFQSHPTVGSFPLLSGKCLHSGKLQSLSSVNHWTKWAMASIAYVTNLVCHQLLWKSWNLMIIKSWFVGYQSINVGKTNQFFVRWSWPRQFCRLKAFFTAFLKKLENHPHVSDCVPIPGACLGWG